MTVIRPNSISGITSLTAHRGSIDFYAHDGSAATFTNINSNVTSGVSTFASLNITGDLDVGGALTYEDVTNIDSVGVVTARNGIDVTGGSVGIGTDNTGSNKLQVQGSSALYGNGGVSATWGDTSYLGALTFDGSSQPVIRTASSKALIFQVNQSTEALRITSGGDVQARRARSNTAGDVALSIKPSDSAIHYGFRIDSANNNLNLDRVGTGNFVSITAGGDVGIGDNAPNSNYGTNLSVHSTATDGARLKLSDGTSGKGNTDGFDLISTGGVAYILNRENADMSFSTNNTERLRISSAGDATFKNKVNIGDSHPGSEILSLGKSSGTSYMAFHNGGANMGFIGYASELISGGASDELGIRSQDDILFSTGGNTERLRIKSDGKIGINASSGWNAFGDVLLVQANTGATAKSMISVRGGSSGYVHSALKLSATTDSNAGNYRGLGVFMHDESSNVEWYAGRPYAQSDYFLVARNTAVSNANAGGVTAQHSRRMWQVDSSGRTVQNGGIYTYQPGQTSGAKTSRAFEGKGAAGTYSQCVVELDQHSYGSVAWDIKVGGYHSAHQHVAGTYYCNGALYANYTSINNSANVSYTRAFVSGQIVRHTFYYHNGFVHPTCEVTATCGGDGYLGPGDITITWS